LRYWNVPKDLALDRTAWKSAIHVPESFTCVFFLLVLVLVSLCFCLVSYVAYPTLLGKKGFVVVVVVVVVHSQLLTLVSGGCVSLSNKKQLI
jgi:uncharacterized membrane protein YpjA